MRGLLVAALLSSAVLLPCGDAWAEETEEAGAAPVQDGMRDPQRNPADPWEGMNRKIFAFNETLDLWILEPVAKGWDWALPDPVQRSVGHFFDNLALPVRAANDLLQAKPWRAYETTWRLVINSVAGVGGLFDVASHYGVYESDEEFGQTLGYWGVPSGPYLVLPFLGPSNPRDTLGLAVDAVSAPQFWIAPFYVSIPATTADVVNDRAAVLETLAAERAAAFDWYSAARSASIQFRENRVRDRAEDEDSEAEDLYYFDEDEDSGAEDLYYFDEDEE